MKRKTHEEFVAEVATSLPTVSVCGEYVNSRTKVDVACDVCGYAWKGNPFDLIRGHGCPRCAGNERKTTERFIQEVFLANPRIEIVGKYVSTSTKILARCLDCGYEWKANPSTLRVGRGCPSCGGTLRKTHDDFVSELASVNPDIEVVGAYENNRTKILVRCARCNHEWSQTPHNLLDSRSRCPRCTHSSTSFVEQYIIGFLNQALGPDAVLERDCRSVGFELDVYVPNLKLAFEPGAWFWHKDKLVYDREKQEACSVEGIRLITIYDKVPSDEEPSGRDVYSFPFDLRVSKDRSELDVLLIKVLEEVAGSPLDVQIDWKSVEDYAYGHSVKTGTDEFVDKLTQKGIDVEVLGVYKSSSSRIQVRCKECGHEWSPRADTLLCGNSACKLCGQKRAAAKHCKSHDVFLAEAAEKNPTVEILGRYTKAADRIQAKCRLCGNEWTPVANTLVMKRPVACPRCWGGKRKGV